MTYPVYCQGVGRRRRRDTSGASDHPDSRAGRSPTPPPRGSRGHHHAEADAESRSQVRGVAEEEEEADQEDLWQKAAEGKVLSRKDYSRLLALYSR